MESTFATDPHPSEHLALGCFVRRPSQSSAEPRTPGQAATIAAGLPHSQARGRRTRTGAVRLYQGRGEQTCTKTNFISLQRFGVPSRICPNPHKYAYMIICKPPPSLPCPRFPWRWFQGCGVAVQTPCSSVFHRWADAPYLLCCLPPVRRWWLPPSPAATHREHRDRHTTKPRLLPGGFILSRTHAFHFALTAACDKLFVNFNIQICLILKRLLQIFPLLRKFLSHGLFFFVWNSFFLPFQCNTICYSRAKELSVFMLW